MLQDGRLVYETYRNGMTETDRHVAHSCSKTLTTMMVGLALEEGRLERSGSMTDYVPELAEVPAWHPVTLEHVLDMATGIDLEEHYEDADSMYWRYADAVGYYADGSAHPRQHARASPPRELTRTAEPPGVRFNYGSYLTNLLPIALANVYGVPAVELYEDRIYRLSGPSSRHWSTSTRTGTRSSRARSTSPCATSSAGATSLRTRAVTRRRAGRSLSGGSTTPTRRPLHGPQRSLAGRTASRCPAWSTTTRPGCSSPDAW